MKKKTSPKKSNKKGMSNSKLMFLSFILLFIVFEALYMVKGQIVPSAPQVAGAQTSR